MQHPDNLKTLWIYYKPRMVFPFHVDIKGYNDLTGHKIIERMIAVVSPAETLE